MKISIIPTLHIICIIFTSLNAHADDSSISKFSCSTPADCEVVEDICGYSATNTKFKSLLEAEVEKLKSKKEIIHCGPNPTVGIPLDKLKQSIDCCEGKCCFDLNFNDRFKKPTID